MSDIPKFIKHFKASAAYHRKKAKQAELEVARLVMLQKRGAYSPVTPEEEAEYIEDMQRVSDELFNPYSSPSISDTPTRGA